MCIRDSLHPVGRHDEAVGRVVTDVQHQRGRLGLLERKAVDERAQRGDASQLQALGKDPGIEQLLLGRADVLVRGAAEDHVLLVGLGQVVVGAVPGVDHRDRELVLLDAKLLGEDIGHVAGLLHLLELEAVPADQAPGWIGPDHRMKVAARRPPGLELLKGLGDHRLIRQGAFPQLLDLHGRRARAGPGQEHRTLVHFDEESLGFF